MTADVGSRPLAAFVCTITPWPGGSMRFLKTAMKILDLPGWHLRLPFEPLDALSEGHVAKRLRDIGIDEWGAQ
jgi:hypothetical protein